MQFTTKYQTKNLFEARKMIETYMSRLDGPVPACLSETVLNEVQIIYTATIPDADESPVLLVFDSGISLLLKDSTKYPPPVLTREQVAKLKDGDLIEIQTPCLYYGVVSYEGRTILLHEVLFLKEMQNQDPGQIQEIFNTVIQQIAPYDSTKVLTLPNPELFTTSNQTFSSSEADLNPSGSSDLGQPPSEPSIHAPLDDDALEIIEHIVRSKVVKRSPGFQQTGAFLATTEIYPMYEYASSLKKALTDDEWKKVATIVNGLRDSASLLHLLHREHYFMEVAVGDTEDLINAFTRVDHEGGLADPKTIKQVQEVDHVLARLPQAAAAGQTFLKVNNCTINGEFTQFLNLFDREHPIYSSVESTSQLAYLRAANDATDHITSYARKYSKQDIENIPKTVHFKQKIKEEHLDFLHDVQVSRKKNDPGSITLRMRGHGGELYGNHNKQKPVHHILKPLARIVTQGLPPVLALRDMYVQDVSVRNQIDTEIRVKCEERASPDIEVHQSWATKDLSFWSNVGVTPTGVLKIHGLVFEEASLQRSFDQTMDHIHHINRLHVVNLSTDLDAFQGLYARTTSMPSEVLPIRIAADLFMEGHDLDVVDAEDFIAFGYCSQTTGKLRAPCYKNHNVTANVDDRARFDEVPHGRRAIVDMSNPHPTPIYIGGDPKWEDKITPSHKEKRQPQYWDFEPTYSEKNFDGHFVHTAQKKEDNAQYLHAKKRLQEMKDGKWMKVIVVCPLRHAQHLIRTFNVVFVLPAPQPMVTGVVLFAQQTKTSFRVTLDHLMELAILLLHKQENVLSTFRKGSKGFDSLIACKLTLEDIPSFYELIRVWQNKNYDRYVTGVRNGPNKRIINSLQKLLRSDEANARKGNIDALLAEQQTRSFSLAVGTRLE